MYTDPSMFLEKELQIALGFVRGLPKNNRYQVMGDFSSSVLQTCSDTGHLLGSPRVD
jgi:hypothetical protein